MARNFDRFRRISRSSSAHRLGEFRRRLFRAHDGKFLGVFKGIADSLGYSVCWTRIIGAFILLSLASSVGANGFKVMVLVTGFFYLLLALLMQPARQPSETPQPAQVPRAATPSSFAASHRPEYPRSRVDLVQLDRHMDGLNRRIQRMEAIVTDREYEWNRRLNR